MRSSWVSIQSVFRTLIPSSCYTSPLTHCHPPPPDSRLLPVQRPLGRFKEEGLPARWGKGEGKVLRRGTVVWLELQQLLTLRSRKGRG